MANFGVPELLIISLILVFMFGSRKIPEFIKGMGQGIKEYRKAVSRK
ncbi:MAG TPA: twin-arginine translocase TatA/TatE family subunit [Patescibacteria group bacterium]|nr:twin-arginine translocase TatA/TatE family subunit [Patescibacteria group bacterium]